MTHRQLYGKREPENKCRIIDAFSGIEIAFGKMCMYSVALASVDKLTSALHAWENLAVDAMDRGIVVAIFRKNIKYKMRVSVNTGI